MDTSNYVMASAYVIDLEPLIDKEMGLIDSICAATLMDIDTLLPVMVYMGSLSDYDEMETDISEFVESTIPFVPDYRATEAIENDISELVKATREFLINCFLSTVELPVDIYYAYHLTGTAYILIKESDHEEAVTRLLGTTIRTRR